MAAVRAVGNLVERILSAGGPLPAWCAEQRKLAGIVAEALDAPPRDGALVTLTQAATGTGKTIAASRAPHGPGGPAEETGRALEPCDAVEHSPTT